MAEERLAILAALPLRIRLVAETLYVMGARVSEVYGETGPVLSQSHLESRPNQEKERAMSIKFVLAVEGHSDKATTLRHDVRDAFSDVDLFVEAK